MVQWIICDYVDDCKITGTGKHVIGPREFMTWWSALSGLANVHVAALLQLDHLDVVGRLTPSMNGNQEFTAPRSFVSQAGPSHWDVCSC
jgi:hypothetical protein